MKVLLVDDEIFTIRMLQNLIHWQELGLEIIGTAANGEEAYEKTVRENPDIIISDIKMPGMNGLEFLKKVKSYNASIRVILMSAYADFNYVRDAIKLGSCDYILKPVDEEELEGALRKAAAEIRGQKEQELVITRSTEQLDKFSLYQYMRTGHGMHKLKNAGQRYAMRLEAYTLYLAQLYPVTMDEYNNSENMELGQEGYMTRLLERRLSAWNAEFAVFDYEEGCWLILLEEVPGRRREEIAQAIVGGMEEDAGIPVRVYFGQKRHGMEALPECYEEVRELSKYGFCMGEEAVLGYGYNCSREKIGEISRLGNLREQEKENVSGQTDAGKAYSKPVRESLAMIDMQYSENISLEEICSRVAVSKNYFCYLFKRETGTSLWNYLTMVRLKQAKKLLKETNLRNYEVAFQVGYDNPSYFSRLFKKQEGMTPNEYRAMHRP